MVSLIASLVVAEAFTTAPIFGRPRKHPNYRRFPLPKVNVEGLRSVPADDSGGQGQSPNDTGSLSLVGVVAPLKYAGPYPCLSLRFPDLNATGAVLDFVLDTGANVNSVNARLVEELDLPLETSLRDLPIVGSAGVGGSFLPGDIVRLGDCQLEGLPPGQDFTFLTNLTAAALSPRASPVCDGLLGLSFFLSFPAGVELDWYGTDGDPPTTIFYYGRELPEDAREGTTRVPLKRLAANVLSMTIDVNGTEVTALLDTGAPMTVLNRRAAEAAGVETTAPEDPDGNPEKFPPLRPPKIGDDVLPVRGVDGGIISLRRSVTPVPIRAGNVSLGEGPIYVGDLPGLAILGGLGDESPPAAVLGLDSLRRTYRTILRVASNEVWFEELRK